LLPPIVYGLAWKKDATARHVKAAHAAGYRAFDTANQPKHYDEPLAGEALKSFPRDSLFIQTKYTSPDGQDSRVPYDPALPFADQVRASFESSLKHLHTDYLDSYLVHGPLTGGLVREDLEIWEAMEGLKDSGRARMIGLSNVSLGQLKAIHERAKLKPEVVQNRCYAARGWDEGVRAFCAANGIVYQGFSLLTANPHVVGSPAAASIAKRLKVQPQQVIFAFSRKLGILPLTGTTDPAHMKDDLEALELKLSGSDAAALFPG
jgi:diketogulonate reductase-like aldo/keto reductase